MNYEDVCVGYFQLFKDTDKKWILVKMTTNSRAFLDQFSKYLFSKQTLLNEVLNFVSVAAHAIAAPQCLAAVTFSS